MKPSTDPFRAAAPGGSSSCRVAALALVACVATIPARAADRLTVVLDWTVNTNHTGLYVAEALGHFDEAGLDVSIETPPDTGGEALVLSGAAEIGIGTQEGVTMARAAGRDLVAIAALIQHNTSGFASRAEAGIERPADMAGRRYGGWGSPIEEAMVRTLVANDGGDPDAVEILPIGGLDFFAATEAGIDVAWVFEGWDVVAAELRGVATNYLPLATEPALDWYTPIVIATGRWLEDHPDLARRFLGALERGYRFAVERPDEAAALLLEAAPELDAGLVRASQRFLAGAYVADADRWGEMDAARWSGFADWLRDNGLLDGEFEPAAAFTNEYLPAAR